MHWPRAWFIYCFIIMATFMSYPNIKWDMFALEMTAIFFAVQIGAYRLDELAGRHCSTDISNQCLFEYATIGILTAFGIGIYILVGTGLYELFIPMFIAGFLIVVYNFDKLFKGFFHNIFWFTISWAFIPVVATYYLHAETINLGIIGLGIFGMLFGWLHIWSYGLTACRHSHTCLDYKPEYFLDEYTVTSSGTTKDKLPLCLKQCHGQTCFIRVMETNRSHYRLAWKLINIQFYMITVLTATIIYIQIGV